MGVFFRVKRGREWSLGGGANCSCIVLTSKLNFIQQSSASSSENWDEVSESLDLTTDAGCRWYLAASCKVHLPQAPPPLQQIYSRDVRAAQATKLSAASGWFYVAKLSLLSLKTLFFFPFREGRNFLQLNIIKISLHPLNVAVQIKKASSYLVNFLFRRSERNPLAVATLLARSLACFLFSSAHFLSSHDVIKNVKNGVHSRGLYAASANFWLAA